MANDIVRVEWDFGNGVRSSTISPTATYTPGEYDVTAYIYDTAGNVHTVAKKLYINVSETDGSLADENYLKSPKCLHFGWKNEHGYGWSLNSGMFAWPQTPASVYEVEENGRMYTIVWDVIDGYEYCINAVNTYNDKVSYKDRGVHPINTKIVTSEFTGEMKRYELSHVETNVKIKPDILSDGFDAGFAFNVGLITETNAEPVEVRMSVDTDKEIVFYWQNKQTQSNTGQRQLQFTTNGSNYQLLTYESFFKSNDKQKRHEINSAQLDFSTPMSWFTRGKGYNYNRATGATSAKGAVDYIGLSPDNLTVPTAAVVIDYDVENVSASGICLWAKDGIVNSQILTLTPYGDAVNGFKLYYYNGVIADNLLLTGTVFDVRVFDTPIPEASLHEYRRDYLQYLPRA